MSGGIDFDKLGGLGTPLDGTVDAAKLINPTPGQVYTLLWSILRRDVTFCLREDSLGPGGWGILKTDAPEQDLSIDCLMGHADHIYGRAGFTTVNGVSIMGDFYRFAIDVGLAAVDFFCSKRITGAYTTLASEAISLVDGCTRAIKGSVSGVSPSTLKGFNQDLVTAKFSPTDSAASLQVANRYFGSGSGEGPRGGVVGLTSIRRVAASKVAPVIGYFETDVAGDGSIGNPYHADIPPLPIGCSHSAVLATGSDGKPPQYRSNVRVHRVDDGLFDAPTYLAFKAALIAKNAISNKEMTKAQAIASAKLLDDFLTDFDFADKSPTEQVGWS